MSHKAGLRALREARNYDIGRVGGSPLGYATLRVRVAPHVEQFEQEEKSRREQIVAQVNEDMPLASVQSKLARAMKLCKGSMNPATLKAMLEAG